jgi:predicted transcriptional regulator
MTVRTLALQQPDYVLTATSLAGDALRQMLSSKRGDAPILDVEDRFVGMFRLRKALKSLLPAEAGKQHGDPGHSGDALPLLQEHLLALRVQPVTELVDRSEVRLDDDTPLLEAIQLLSRSCGPLPVVSPDGRLRGLLSSQEVLAHLNGAG